MSNELPIKDDTLAHIPRILVVEDDLSIGEIIVVTLKRDKMLAIHESSGQEALARFEKMNPDAVLLDLNLPDMNGWEVLDAIKEGHPNARPPAVVILTAYSDPSNRLMGKIRGVDAYLVKPFTPSQVSEVVREVIDQRRYKGKQAPPLPEPPEPQE
jgi:DNA-binding response OmpR family regulator